MIFPLPRMTTYSGAKPCSTSTPILDLGRSMTWPTDAFTVKPVPRYFLIVLALAGDSTTTRARPLDALAGLRSLGAAAFAAFFFGAGAVFFLASAAMSSLYISASADEHNARRPRAQQVPQAPGPPP